MPEVTLPETYAMRSLIEKIARGAKIPHEPITHKLGDYATISKHELNVDHQYQRPESNNRAKALAVKWSFAACGAITVSVRILNGKETYWVIDGQHRLLAAMTRDDVDKLPCLCFRFPNLASEAEAFEIANTHRSYVTALERLPGQIVQEKKIALDIQRLVEMSGRQIAKKTTAKSIMCIGVLSRCLADDTERMFKLWPLMINLMHGYPMKGEVIRGIFHLEGLLNKEDISLTMPVWSKRICKVGFLKISDMIMKAAAMDDSGRGPRVCATGVLAAINYGLVNKLVVSNLG